MYIPSYFEMKSLTNQKNSIHVLISSYLLTESNRQINEVVEGDAVQQVTFIQREKVAAF